MNAGEFSKCVHHLFLTFSFLDIDFDPRKAARDERKARVTKNQKQHEANAARAQKTGSSASNPEREAHKKDLERTLAMSRTSTASMGKFDRKLEGEKKMKGIKRKVRFVFPSFYPEPKFNGYPRTV